MSHPRIVLDGAEDAVDEDLKWSEVGIIPVDLQGVARRTQLEVILVTISPLVLSLFQRSRWSLRLLPFTLLLGRSARRARRRLFQLYGLLCSR